MSRYPKHYEGEEEEGMRTKQGYETLGGILQSALDQAQDGKGADRHGTEDRWEDQPSPSDAKLIGPAAPVFQCRKKALESLRLSDEAAVQELYGVINYAAMAIYGITARAE
jgi:hypothetical protein